MDHDTLPRGIDDSDEPPITIRMDGAQVVIRLDTDLDADATEAFAAALNAAVDAGSMVIVELERSDPLTAVARDTPSPPNERFPSSLAEPIAPAIAVGVGLVQLASASSCWTVDLRARRLFRGDAVVDRRFLPASAWTGLRRLWVSATALTALTSFGSFVSAPRVAARGAISLSGR